jgi:hypothetical protein
MRRRLPFIPVVVGLALALTGCRSAAAPTFTFAPASQPIAATPSGAPSASPPASVAASAAPSASPLVSAAPVSAPPGAGPAISLSEWSIVAAGTMKSGKTQVAIANVGAAPHELLVFKSNRDPSAYPVDAAGDIKEEGAGVNLVSYGENIAPGGTQSRTLDLTPGKYLFVCNIPGHFKQGMYAVVFVTP